MRGNNGLDSIVLKIHQGLIQEVERLPIVLPNGFLEVRASILAETAFDAGTAAGLVTHPQTDDLDAVRSELGDVGLLFRVRHGLHEVVAGASPGLGALTLGRRGADSQGESSSDN